MTREEAIKTLKENYCAMCAYGSQDMDSCDIRSCDNRDAIKALENQKTRHWIDCAEREPWYKCSECEEKILGSYYKYCPNCGAKMEVDKE